MTTEELVQKLEKLAKRFYEGQPPQAWWSQRRDVIMALARPAKWLHDRGVTLPPHEYIQFISAQITAIHRHGNYREGYFPAYLETCLKTRVTYHCDQLYERGKHVRNLAEKTLARIRSTPQTPQPDPVTQLAELRSLLFSKKKSKPTAKKIAVKPQEPTLFAL